MNRALLARIKGLEQRNRRPGIFFVDKAKIGNEGARTEIARLEAESERIGVESIIIVFDKALETE